MMHGPVNIRLEDILMGCKQLIRNEQIYKPGGIWSEF